MIINIDIDTLICAIAAMTNMEQVASRAGSAALALRMQAGAASLRNALGLAEEFGATDIQETVHGDAN